MAEETQSQEKTEEATPRKKTKAREEGQVARSRELNSMAVVSFGALGLMAFAPWGAGKIMDLTRLVFELARAPEANWLEALSFSVTEALWVIIPLLFVLLLAGAGSSLAVGGFLISGKAVAFKANRMSPVKGFKRMFSARSLVELVKSLAKFVLIAGVAVLTLLYVMEDLLVIGFLAPQNAVAQGLWIVMVALLLIGSTLVLIAAIDVPFQIAQHTKQLKMTKQEVKDEMKDSEGKPEVKSRIRQLQQEIAQRRMLEDVPSADVVITNPEHFSVAIRYDSAAMGAPVVVAKGADHMAFRIREIADAHEVPMLPVPALTRAVYYATDLGEEIPSGLYMAVAQVLAYIYQLQQYRRGQVPQPPHLGPLSVPPEFFVEGEQ